MPVFTDQTGRNVNVASARRIISLVPSQTELLSDLGLNDEVAGITKFCVHPESWFRTKTRVGGTKQVKLDIVHQLKPDLIIANKEENVKEQVEELARHYPVWTSDINNLDNAYEMIEQIGIITNKKQQAKEITSRIREKFLLLPTTRSPLPTVYLIWQKPWMTVGGDTFINCMLEAAGFDNVFKNKTRYPEIKAAELQTSGCELLLLSSEPFPFRQKHVDELQLQLQFPNTKILLVDGEMFSWYGSRLIHAPGYYRQLHEQIKLMRT